MSEQIENIFHKILKIVRLWQIIDQQNFAIAFFIFWFLQFFILIWTQTTLLKLIFFILYIL